MRRVNKKTLLVLGVLILAVCSVAAVAATYFLNKERRQRVLLQSAEQYMSEGDPTRAVLQYKRALQLGVATGDMYYKYGLCLEQMKQPAQALQAFERAATLDPDLRDAWKRVVPVYYVRARLWQGRSEEEAAAGADALKRLRTGAEALARLTPEDSEGYVWLARARMLQGDADAALEALGSAPEPAASADALLAERILLLMQADRLDEAETQVNDLLRDRPESAELLLASAAVLGRAERTAEQETALRKVVELHPEEPRARRMLALLCWRQGRHAEAEEQFKAVCDLLPEKADEWLALGGFYAAVDRPEDAVAAFRRARELDTRSLAPLVEMARVQIDSRHFDDARSTLAELEKREADPAVTAWLAGLLELAEGKTSVARSKLLEAVRKSRADFPEAQYALGLCYMREGNLGAAEESLTAATHSPAMENRARLALAELYLQERLPDRALEECARVAVGGGRSAYEPHLITGRAQLQKMDLDAASAEFQSALNSTERPERKVQALVLLHSVALARHLLAVRLDRTDEAAALLAEMQGYVDQARGLSPDDPSVDLIESQLAELRGDPEAAKAYLEKAASSPDAAARFIRNQLGRPQALDVPEGEAHSVASLAARHPDAPEVQGAAADYFAGAAAITQARARALPEERRTEALKNAEAYRSRAIECARKVHELDETDTFNAVRLFDLLITVGRRDEAAALAEKLAQTPAPRSIGLGLSALLLNEAGDSAKAVSLLNESIALNDRDWRTHFWLGRVYAATRDGLPQAEVSLGRALELRPTAVQARELLFDVYERQGKFERVQAEIEKLLTQSPGDVRLLARSARLFERTGDLAKAYEWRQRLARVMPMNVESHIECARLALMMNRPDEALAAAKNATAADPASVPALRMLLLGHLARHDAAAAEEALRNALAARPDDPSVVLLAGEFYTTMGRPEEAEAGIKELVAKRPEDEVARLRLAEYYAGQGRNEEALAEYEALLRLKPELSAAEMRIVWVQLAQLRTAVEPARADLIKRIETRLADLKARFPNNIQPHLASADLLLAENRLDEAEAALVRLPSQFGESPELRKLLAQVYLQRGKLEPARMELEKAVEANPQYAEALLLLAQLDMEQNRFIEALARCAQVLKYYPANVSALDMAARVEQRIGRGSDAIERIRQIVRLRPADRAAQTRLVQALMQLQRDREAMAAAREGYERNPADAGFLEDYVNLLLNARRAAEAEVVCKTFLASQPEREDTARLILAKVQFNAGKAAEAEESLRAAEAAAVDRRTFLFTAHAVCLASRQTERAIELASRLVAEFPEDEAARLTNVRTLLQAGRPDESLAAVMDAVKALPDSYALLSEAVNMLAMAQRLEEARALCADFLERRPGEAPPRLMLADLLVRLGRAEDALPVIKEVESIVGDALTPELAQALMRAYAAAGQPREGERVAKRLCELAPEDARSWLTYAESRADADQREVNAVYREALKHPLRSGFSRMLLLNNLAYGLSVASYEDGASEAGALAEAEEMATSVLGDRETAPTFLLDTLGWIRLRRGHDREAQEWLSIVVNRPDATAENWYHHALSCARTGQAQAARASLNKALESMPDRTDWQADVEAEIARAAEMP